MDIFSSDLKDKAIAERERDDTIPHVIEADNSKSISGTQDIPEGEQ